MTKTNSAPFCAFIVSVVAWFLKPVTNYMIEQSFKQFCVNNNTPYIESKVSCWPSITHKVLYFALLCFFFYCLTGIVFELIALFN